MSDQYQASNDYIIAPRLGSGRTANDGVPQSVSVTTSASTPVDVTAYAGRFLTVWASGGDTYFATGTTSAQAATVTTSNVPALTKGGSYSFLLQPGVDNFIAFIGGASFTAFWQISSPAGVQ
jgi:hypothetical protein